MEPEKKQLGRQEENEQRGPESWGRRFPKEVWLAVSNAAKNSSEMKAEKRPFNLSTRKWKLSLPEQLQGSGGPESGRRESVRGGKEEEESARVHGLFKSSLPPQCFRGSQWPMSAWVWPRRFQLEVGCNTPFSQEVAAPHQATAPGPTQGT